MKRTAVIVAPFIILAACHGGGGPPPATPQEIASGDLGGSGASGSVGFAVAEAPMSLAASDGTGLRLASITAKAVVDGRLAFTELHLTFANPLDRTLEGTFRMALPQGASLGRFAMKIEGAWQEGEVVELAAARRAYEDFLHRKQDPALMEKAAGNEFSARVFPIPARGTKEIIVAWAAEVQDGRYVLPLKGLPEVDALNVDVKVADGSAKMAPISERNKAPSDVVLALPKESSTRPSAVRNGELAIVRVKPQATTAPDPIASAVVLVDTSASRVLGFDAEVDLVGRIVKKIAENNGTVTVACFDQATVPVFEGRAADFGDREIAKIRAHGALGASNIEQALGFAQNSARKTLARRVVLVTDGVATAGATDAAKLLPKVVALKESGIERIDAVAVGGIRDEAGLLRMVRGNLAHDGIVADATRDAGDAVRRLGEATRSRIAVKVEGATWTYPTQLDGVQAGDAFSIYAELPKDRELKVSVAGGSAERVETRLTDRPLVERIVAQAKVSSLLERERTAPSAEDLKTSIIAIATRNRIMTPYTAMLVLESESDYRQYGIARTSLADVLAVRDGRVERIHRQDLAIANAASSDDDVRFMKKDALEESEADTKRREAASAQAPRGGVAPPRRPAPSDGMVDRPGSSGAPPPPSAKAAAAPLASEALTESRASAPSRPARAGLKPASPAPAPTMAAAAPRPQAGAQPMEQASRMERSSGSSDPEGREDGPRHGKAPYEGRLATVMDQIARGQVDHALSTARAWRTEAPGDVLALVALGEAAEASSQGELAARAYGSVIDLFSNRADLRRFAGERLERLAAKDPAALDLAIDAFEKAVADRPDHPSSHRLLTFALLRGKQWQRAFDAAAAATRQAYDSGRFNGVDRILREDLGLVGAAWARAEPSRRQEIEGRVRDAGGMLENAPSLRFVLNWETDANDVDFHIHDGRGGHAYFGARRLRSGGELYADVTTGYGPECFTIRGAKRAGPYRLEAHYYSRGPMGYGMGKLEVVDHDGKGNLTFEERPFIVMVDQAYVDLGIVK